MSTDRESNVVASQLIMDDRHMTNVQICQGGEIFSVTTWKVCIFIMLKVGGGEGVDSKMC